MSNIIEEAETPPKKKGRPAFVCTPQEVIHGLIPLRTSTKHIARFDVSVLQFLAYTLDSSDTLLVKSALETLKLFSQNKATHSVINSTFGIMESVKHVSTRYVGIDTGLVELAQVILSSMSCPAYGTRSRKLRQQKSDQEQVQKLKTKVITLLVHGLCLEKQPDLEAALVRLREVVSFVVDVIHQRCTMRVLLSATPKAIVETIAAKTSMTAKLVARNKLNQEVLIPVLGEGDEAESNLPPYLPEEESPVRGKAVSMLGGLHKNARGVFKWFQDSFYW